MNASTRGFDRRAIATSDVRVGDFMNAPGAGMILPVIRVERLPTRCRLTLGWREPSGRARHYVISRGLSGQSTIYVPAV